MQRPDLKELCLFCRRVCQLLLGILTYSATKDAEKVRLGCVLSIAMVFSRRLQLATRLTYAII